jgi:hypothetical protein
MWATRHRDVWNTVKKFSGGFLLITVVFVLSDVWTAPAVYGFIHSYTGQSYLLTACVLLIVLGWYLVLAGRGLETQYRFVVGVITAALLSLIACTRCLLHVVPGRYMFVWYVYDAYHYPYHHPWFYALIILSLYFVLFSLSGVRRVALVSAMTLLVMIR